MHISEAREFLAAALDNDEIEFNEDGVCDLESESGIGMSFVLAPPELHVYCIPFLPDDYAIIENKTGFLEALLAINYEADIDFRQEFKIGFHRQLQVPIVVVVKAIEDLQSDMLQTTCDDLHAIALIIRETVVGDGFAVEEDETAEPEEHELAAFEGTALRL